MKRMQKEINKIKKKKINPHPSPPPPPPPLSQPTTKKINK